ncbi:proline dehydrogenase family protein [Terriglobus sp. RCC_193]|uniref:proline dehydrogenase family protein n=1 Tax=Terriglobus sp. RCC_193 TaxID=3239218 RepID=UPI003523BB77
MFRSFLISLSQNNTMRGIMERSAPGRRLSSRFVAGLTVEDALRVTRDLNAQGFAVTADALGESVRSEAEAVAAADIYHRLLEGIMTAGLNANVSLKLTGVGMDVSAELAERTTGDIVAHAAHVGNFVRIDMEGTPYTEATIALTERLAQQYPGAVGTVLQAYLYRTAEDAARLLRQGIRIRLCKGAYKEAGDVAFPAKSDVDANYVRLMQTMLPSGVFCGIATHDPAMVQATEQFAAEHNIPRSAFEFQMLYGVKRELQRDLVRRGYGVRIYLPFGTDWYPYFMRRLAERPANVLFLLRNLVSN